MDEHGSPDVAQVLAKFAQLLAQERTVDEILRLLGDYCTQLLPVDGVGVLLRADGGLDIGTANSDPGRRVEELEVALREGPCTDSLETGQQITVPDLAAAVHRYPRFVPQALEAGVRSIHALPLTARLEQLGALDVIALSPVALTSAQLATTQMLADVAVAFLVTTRALEERTRLAEQLQRALDSRIVVEQAKGVLAERHGCTVAEAFERLRHHARSNQRKLQDVAAEVVAGELDL